MEEEVFLTPEESLSKLGDIILSNILRSDPTSKARRQMMFGQLSPKVFRDENYILYLVLYSFKEKMITPDEEFLRMYLLRNENVIINAGANINLSAFSDEDENPVVGYTSAVIAQYRRLMGLPCILDDEFTLTIEKYKEEYKALEIDNAYNVARVILYDGMKFGRKLLHGFDDSISYVKRKIADIESILDNTKGLGFLNASVVGLEDKEEVKPEKIGDFGDIDELNKYLGGIYTPNFYSILAPTKGGKSKFTSKMAHNIVVENGNNMVVWAHEGGYYAWLCQLRAIHFDYIYNKHQSDATKYKMGVCQDTILKDDFPSEEIKQLEDASRVDLFTNQEYGNIYMIDRPFKVETFIDEIETAVQTNNAKAVLIDYLQLIEWESSSLSKSQAIGKAYQKLLAYAKKRNIAVISPAQFTQEFMNELAKSKDGVQHEVRTAGGESSEIIRTPDVNIALYASAEDLINHVMKILSVPSRMAAPFPSFDINCDLGPCYFSSISEEDN